METYLKELEEEKNRINSSLLSFASLLKRAKEDKKIIEKSIKIFFDTFERREKQISELCQNS